MRHDDPTPCMGASDTYDLLMDHTAGWEFRAAHREALTLCGQCPVRECCWTENRGEDWVKRLQKPAPALKARWAA